MAGRRASTGRLLRLAAELQRLRLARTLTLEQAEEASGVDNSQISRLERGHHRPTRRTLIALLHAYGITDAAQQRIWVDWMKNDTPLHWLGDYRPYLTEAYQAYAGLEATASRIQDYESMYVPGLLQTADHTRALIRDGEPGLPADVLERLTEVRGHRQNLLHRADAPRLQLHAVIDEAVLHRAVGGPAVMRAQLRHLAEVALTGNVVLQVVPFQIGATPGMPGTLAVIEFDGPFGTPLAYTDGIQGEKILHAPDEVNPLITRLTQITSRALDPASSAQLIEQAAATV